MHQVHTVEPLLSMWGQEAEIMIGTNDLEHYNIDRVLFQSDERANLDVLEWSTSMC